MRGGYRSCGDPEHVGSQDVPADAGQSLDIKHTIRRHLTPLADGTRRHTKLSGDTGLCPAPLFLKEFLDINHGPVVAQLKRTAKHFFSRARCSLTGRAAEWQHG